MTWNRDLLTFIWNFLSEQNIRKKNFLTVLSDIFNIFGLAALDMYLQ
jgi:hypothetical protein